MNTLTKSERICGKTTIAALLSQGQWTSTAHIKCCHASRPDAEMSRIMVSVPKKFFKSAVDRNRLKRCHREAYRTQKSLLGEAGADILFAWSSPEMASQATVQGEVAVILKRIAK